MVTNLDHFIFNSDYPIDKVVFYKQEAITIPAKTGGVNGTLTVTIPHHLQFMPLPLALWATDADFSDTRTLEPLPYDIGMEVIKADATNITVEFESSKNTATSAYLRVYGLLPQDAIYEVAPTSRQSSALIFDTDKIYTPLIFSGIFTSDLDPDNVAHINVSHGYKEYTGQAFRAEIEHNLGNYPFMTIWHEDNGEIELNGNQNIYYGYHEYEYSYSDTNKCNFYCTPASPGRWHIRIYANV